MAQWKSESSDAWSDGNRLYVVFKTKGSIRLPRLANVVKAVHWVSDADRELSLHPQPGFWMLEPDAIPENSPAIILLELDAPAVIFSESLRSKPDADGIILLPAKMAKTNGQTLRFEPQPHKNTVGYWSHAADTAEWQFDAQNDGDYEVDILQGCGKGHGGSTVEVVVGNDKLKFDVQETGHFQNFIWRTLGTVRLVASEHHTLQLVPVQKAAGAVMDVRAVRLVPAGQKRSFQAELANPDVLPKIP